MSCQAPVGIDLLLVLQAGDVFFRVRGRNTRQTPQEQSALAVRAAAGDDREKFVLPAVLPSALVKFICSG